MCNSFNRSVAYNNKYVRFQATTTECPPNNTLNSSTNKNTNNLLRKLASSHYQSYTTALTVTIAVGCFLLLLNILIFAGIYHQRDRSKNKGKKKEEAALTSVEGGKNYFSGKTCSVILIEIAHISAHRITIVGTHRKVATRS